MKTTTDIDSLIDGLLEKRVFIAGFCLNPDDDEPDLRIRVFQENGHRCAAGFTSMAAMKRFFKVSGLTSLKYMELEPPTAVESCCGINCDMLLNAETNGQHHLPVQDLKRALQRRLGANNS